MPNNKFISKNFVSEAQLKKFLSKTTIASSSFSDWKITKESGGNRLRRALFLSEPIKTSTTILNASKTFSFKKL